jgi:hypothetical protein
MDEPALCVSLLACGRLSVCVQRHFAVRMSHGFLYHFDVFTVRDKQRREGSAQSVPADSTSDASALRSGPQMSPVE